MSIGTYSIIIEDLDQTGTSPAMEAKYVPDDQRSLTIQYSIMVIYGFASIIIYITNIFVLRRLKHVFHTTFARFYTAAAIASIIYFLSEILTCRFLKLGYFTEAIHSWLKEPNFFILFTYRIPSTYCPVLILALNTLISFNRVTAVSFPMKSRLFWERNAKYFLIGCCFLPLLFMWFVIPFPCFTYILQKGGLAFDYIRIQGPGGPLSFSFHAAVAGILFGIATLINTLFIFFNVKARKVKTDTGMLVFEILLAVFTLVFAASQVAYYINAHLRPDKEAKEFIEQYSEYFIDLFILPPAWTLFFCNRSVRRETAKLLKIDVEQFVVFTSNPSTLRQVHPA